MRYALQVRRSPRRWRTVKSYQPEQEEFRVLERVVFLAASKFAKDFRLLIMPANVVAVRSF